MELIDRLRLSSDVYIPGDQGLIFDTIEQLEKLTKLGIVARGILRTVHEGFREDIDFNELSDVLESLGLYVGTEMVPATEAIGRTLANGRGVISHVIRPFSIGPPWVVTDRGARYETMSNGSIEVDKIPNKEGK